MKKIIILVMSAMMISGCSIPYKFQKDNISVETYNRYCPYGSAYIINKEENRLLEGNATKFPVDCVNYSEMQRLWITWKSNSFHGKKFVQEWNPEDYEVYSEKGKLTISEDNKVIINN